MRIAFFVSGFPIRSETFVLTQITGLLDRGHDIHIYANEIHDSTDLHADFRRYQLFDRTRLRRSVRRPGPFGRVLVRLRVLARNILRQPALVLRALNFVRYGKPALSLDLLDMALCFPHRPVYDVVHCHFGPNGNDAALLQELGVLRGKLVTTFHSYDVLCGIRSHGRIYRRLVRRADAVHSISEYNRKSLESFGFAPERIHYHPIGINLRHFPPRSHQKELAAPIRILTVARLAPAKGLEYALDAVAEIHRERPALRLHYRIIGGGPLLSALEAKAERLGLRSIVEFSGPQDQAVVRAALLEADIFLLPSLAEALPIPIMEAMASELPAIATDVGGVAELVRDGETGRLVSAADAKALRAALTELVEASPAERRRLGTAGRVLVMNRHDTAAVTDRLVAHYQALVAGCTSIWRPGKGSLPRAIVANANSAKDV